MPDPLRTELRREAAGKSGAGSAREEGKLMKTGAKEIVFPSECRLLKGLTPEEYRDLCGCMKARELHLRNKQTFVIETDPCDRIGIVVSGAVQLSRTRIDGGRNVLETVLPNDTFGTTYVFRDVKTSASA